jgi:ABC-type transport system involved in multi-copper enzyme maturation permease subunit
MNGPETALGAQSSWVRQLGAVVRLEWKKTLVSKRGWWIYLLALGPVALALFHWLVMIAHPVSASRHSLADDSGAYAAVFQFFYLRGAIFFGCMGIFTNLFRGEMLEKTLHYYYLTPLRRELLVAGKYLAALATALALFVTSAAASFLLIGRHFGEAYSGYVWHGPGLGQLGWYTLTAALACAGYGAVFLLCGLRYRNPMIPAAVVYVWENLNPFLPSLLQKISVISYLRGLVPVEVPVPPPFNVMVVDTDATPAWLAVSGLLALTLVLLAYSAVKARQGEISYGE